MSRAAAARIFGGAALAVALLLVAVAMICLVTIRLVGGRAIRL